MAIRISGMNSGLDTDSIVTALVSDVKERKDKYVKAKTKLTWQQDAWKSINKKVYSLYNKASNMRWSSAYNMKKTTVSDATKATVSASNTAVNGTQKLNISKLAQAGYLTGGKIDGDVTEKTLLAELGYSGGEGNINITKGDGTTTTISVGSSTTIADLNKMLKNAGLNATFDANNKRIFVSSKDTGTANDFNLTAGDSKGLEALQLLGLATGVVDKNGDDTATGTSYKAYAKYAAVDGALSDGTLEKSEVISDQDTIRTNIENALADYKTAKANYEKYSVQNDNLKQVAQSYGKAYAGTQDFYATYGVSYETDSEFQSVMSLSSSERNSSVIGSDGKVYSQSPKTDSDGNTVYSRTEGDTTTYIVKKSTYSDEDGKVYTKNKDGDYLAEDGTKYTGDTSKLTENAKYYEAEEKMIYVDSSGKKYDVKSRTTDEGKTEYYYNDGSRDYVCSNEEGYFYNSDIEMSTKISKSVDYETGSEITSSITSASKLYDDYKAGLIGVGTVTEDNVDNVLAEFSSKLTTVNNFEKKAEAETDEEKAIAGAYSKTSLVAAVKQSYQEGGASKVEEMNLNYISEAGTIKTNMTAEKSAMDENSVLASLADLSGTEYTTALNKAVNSAAIAAQALSSGYTSTATKIDGEDAKIKLNGVEFTSSTNTISVNGITITAMAETGDEDKDAITITTKTDAQGLYDKIKDFLSEYNEVINEICSLYNADYNKDYEPLTDDEKEEMSDKEIEQWEEKAKESLLRHDSTLNSLINTMTSSMMSSIKIGEKSYSLSSFGISTLGYLNAAKNENYAYHIDGDEDDESTSGNNDKLLAMINSNPDDVADFFKELSTTLYKNLDTKMKSTTLSSAYTIYNDKQMTKDLTSYTKLIKTWEEKLADKEEYYYKQFTAMEKSMASINSTQSSLSSYFS